MATIVYQLTQETPFQWIFHSIDNVLSILLFCSPYITISINKSKIRGDRKPIWLAYMEKNAKMGVVIDDVIKYANRHIKQSNPIQFFSESYDLHV